MRMRKDKDEYWTWYPTKRLAERKGLIGSALRRIEEWSPFETVGNQESRKQSISGENKREEYAEENDVRIPFDHLPQSIKNYAERKAQKTGVSVKEVLGSKPFKKYLLSKLK